MLRHAVLVLSRVLTGLILGLFISSKIINLLGHERFAFITSYLSLILFSGFLNVGLSFTTQRFFGRAYAIKDLHTSKSLTDSVFVVVILFSLISTILYILFQYILFNSFDFKMIVLGSIYLILSFFASALNNISNAFSNFRINIMLALSDIFFKIIFMIYIIFFSVGIVSYFLYLIIPLALGIILNLVFTYKSYYKKLFPIFVRGSYLRIILFNSYHNGIMSIAAAINGQLPTLLLEKYTSPVFISSRGILTYLQTSLMQIANVAQTVLSSGIFAKSVDNSLLFKKNIWINFLIGFFLYFILLFFGRHVLYLWLGSHIELLDNWIVGVGIIVFSEMIGQPFMIQTHKVGKTGLYSRAEILFSVFFFAIPMYFLFLYLGCHELYSFLAISGVLNVILKVYTFYMSDRALFDVYKKQILFVVLFLLLSYLLTLFKLY